MKRLLLIACLLPALSASAQMFEYFEHIRKNEAALTAFFAAMPKGGDLHHHYSGSVYAETYLDYVIDNDYALNPGTLEVLPATTDTVWRRFSWLREQKLLDTYKQRLLQKWSVKDYNGVSYPSDKQFFETFGAFNVAVGPTFNAGLLELKARAKREHVAYIETMFSSIPCAWPVPSAKRFDEQLALARTSADPAALASILRQLEAALPQDSVRLTAARFADSLGARHARLGLDDTTFTIRYQTYISRTNQSPATLFRNLLLAFEAARKSPLIVGVNIVAPEDNEISMRDYWLHMQMFSYCRAKFPGVKTAMHAGELALGMVRPEDLSWHINAAVRDAGADRIGHGADLPYESNSGALLERMRERKVAVEINLYSNEFILKLKEDAHPISLYRAAGVPIVICTDDAGVLRSNLTRQYVLLAQRYPKIGYAEIRSFVRNSIAYSFIEEPRLRQRLLDRLEADLTAFEAGVIAAQYREENRH